MADVDSEIQRLMLERLHIAWPPGEPFYSIIEAEIVKLRSAITTYLDDDSDENWDVLANLADSWEPESQDDTD